jgi:hypothetical protein
MKHEVFGKTLRVATHLLVESLRRHAIQRRQVGIQHHPLAADRQDALLDSPDGDDRAFRHGRSLLMSWHVSISPAGPDATP